MHNFGVKSVVPIQNENEAPLGPEGREEENREEVFIYNLLINSTHQLWGLGER